MKFAELVKYDRCLLRLGNYTDIWEKYLYYGVVIMYWVEFSFGEMETEREERSEI